MRLNLIRIAQLLVLTAVTAGLQAQVRPLPTPYVSAAPINYIRTWEPQVKLQTDNLSTQTPLATSAMATQYLDGLGKAVQTVVKEGSIESASNQKADLVSATEYDDYGRVKYQYLPFAANTAQSNTSLDNGLFKLNPFQQQSQYAAAQFPGESYFYGAQDWETNPLQRVVSTTAPGQWMQQGKKVQTSYLLNTLTDEVRIWNVNGGGNFSFSTYTSPGTYLAGRLTKLIVKDEHGKQVITYTDKEGHVILKKVQLIAAADNGSGSNHDNWLCTYYIYDDIGRLQCVVQPEGVKTLVTNGFILTSATLLNEQCFRYQYDAKGRMTLKKVPGAEEVRMIYDLRDRLVMTQDGNARAAQRWMYTAYDELDRVIETGLFNDNSNFNNPAIHASAAAGLLNYPLNGCSSCFDLTHTGYGEDYPALPQLILSYAAPVISSFSSEGWDVVAEVPVVHGEAVYKTAALLPYQGSPRVMQFRIAYDRKGRVVQTRSNNISGDSQEDIVTTQYDWRGKSMLTISKQYYEAGSPAQTILTASRPVYDLLGRIVKTETMLSHSALNGGAWSAWHNTQQSQYDKQGQLVNKKLAPDFNTSAGLENLKYDYNIRGWLLGINRDYAKDAAGSNNYFGFDLGYEKQSNGIIGNQSYTASQWNGNITGTVWKSKGDGEKRRLDFTYDAANRLLTAPFTQYTGGGFNNSAQVDFSLNSMSYDANGNILTMNQNGLKINSSSTIDGLKYTYIDGGNRLKSVVDFNNLTDTKLGDFRFQNSHPQYAAKAALTSLSSPSAFDAITDYAYDGNGNMLSDQNKGISSIVYNVLNLPQTITIPAKGTIEYVYDASGTKLRKVVTENNATVPYNGANYTTKIISTIDYVSGAVYEKKAYSNSSLSALNSGPMLQFIPHEEGRIRYAAAPGNAPATWKWDYMLKDHLGNVRAVITEDQQQDIYPAATLETNLLSVETQFYEINSGNIVDKSAATGITNYANNNSGVANNNTNCSGTLCTTDLSQKLYRLNSTGAKTGLGITLKIMAGDRIDVFGKSYYFQNNPGGGTGSTVPVIDILNGFLGGATGAVATSTHGAVSGTQINTTNGTSIINSMLTEQGNQSNGNTSKPKSFINVILFDEQFKAVGYRVSMVGTNGTVNDHFSDLQNIAATKNGYVYIYCSNESAVNVYFDNLQVVHTRGQLLEETHYYPFGLTMAGITSRAATVTPNKYKYNGIEEEKELDLNNLSAKFRDLDPQTGRWWQIDPKVDEMYSWSPYASNFDNPIRYEDHDGDMPDCCPGLYAWAAKELSSNPNSGTSKVIGAVAGVGNSIQKTATGLYNTVRHPLNTLEGIAKMNTIQGQVGMAIAVGNKVEAYKKGSGAERAMILSEAITDVATAVVATKGVGLIKGTGLAGEVGNISKTAGQLGREGMAAAGIEQNAARIPSLTGTAKYRVPDGLSSTTITEVKNVAKQGWTSQLQDYSQYAQKQGLSFDLFVRPTTQLSKPLQQQVIQGNVNLKTLPSN